RMTGSAAEGEDVVQDTLARAYYELPGLKELPALRAWLFRIAHNRALDYGRRYERRMGAPLEEAMELPDENTPDPESALAREQAVRLAVARFLELAPGPRSCVILKDVLGHSLEEIAALMQLGLPAVKAALHRGRGKLQELSKLTEVSPERPLSPALLRYAELFNAHDWDGVRAMLLDDVRLDLVSRSGRVGRESVSHYFTNYGKIGGWRMAPGWLDGREILAVFVAARDERPSYFVELVLAEGRVACIRDFRYVPYIASEADIRLAG
ncbi:MAG: sigma-70 family RNA polymerase sigma factor, partial [Burkholderiales bacterium]